MAIPGVYSAPLVQFRVEMAIGTGDGEAFLYDAPDALYDSANYAGDEIYWVDVSTRLISCSTTRGRDRYAESFKAGSATFILEDSDGIFNPDVTGLSIGDLTLRPGRYTRLLGKLNLDTEWTPIFTGRIDTIEEIYRGAGHAARARFQVTELATSMSRDNPPALETPVGAGELTSDRAIRVLTAAGFDPDKLTSEIIDVGSNTMQSTDLPESYWNEFQNAAQAEGGAAYFLADGRPRFRSQGWLDNGPDEGSVRISIGSFDDQIKIVRDPRASWDSARVRNDIQLARAGGTVVKAFDSASVSAYGRRSFRLFDYQNDSDVAVQALADGMLSFFRYDRARLSELEIYPTEEQSVRDCLAIDLGWRARLTIATARGWGFTQDVWIQRVSHELAEGGDWKIAIVTDNTDRNDPQNAGPFSCDHDESFSRGACFAEYPWAIETPGIAAADNDSIWEAPVMEQQQAGEAFSFHALIDHYEREGSYKTIAGYWGELGADRSWRLQVGGTGQLRMTLYDGAASQNALVTIPGVYPAGVPFWVRADVSALGLVDLYFAGRDAPTGWQLEDSIQLSTVLLQTTGVAPSILSDRGAGGIPRAGNGIRLYAATDYREDGTKLWSWSGEAQAEAGVASSFGPWSFIPDPVEGSPTLINDPR